LFGGEDQVVFVRTIDHPRVECCKRIDAAHPQCMRQMDRDRIFIEIGLL